MRILGDTGDMGGMVNMVDMVGMVEICMLNPCNSFTLRSHVVPRRVALA